MDVLAQVSKKPSRKIYKWSKADWEGMKNDTNIFCHSYLSEAPKKTVEDNNSTIESHLKDVLNKHVPSKMSRTRTDVPWLSPDLKRQCRRKHLTEPRKQASMNTSSPTSGHKSPHKMPWKKKARW